MQPKGQRIKMDKRPIGVFDSGLGGLTVVKELQKVLPGESIIYFGDTGRVPYGSKSEETIIQYTKEIFSFMEEKNVKAVVAACGTVSSVMIKHNINPKVLFTGVVVPSCLSALQKSKNKRIGLIGTKATVKSNSYASFISRIDANAEVFSVACPLFVPLVEAGMFREDNEIVKKTVEYYLSEFKDKNIDTIILGCTHYPLLKDVIRNYLGDDIEIIDSGIETADLIKKMLNKNDMLSEEINGKYEFYVSDSVEDFIDNAGVFLEKEIKGQTLKKVL